MSPLWIIEAAVFVKDRGFDQPVATYIGHWRLLWISPCPSPPRTRGVHPKSQRLKMDPRVRGDDGSCSDSLEAKPTHGDRAGLYSPMNARNIEASIMYFAVLYGDRKSVV
mgnify:CR=1 FL=1